jgi:hypothetical protein
MRFTNRSCLKRNEIGARVLTDSVTGVYDWGTFPKLRQMNQVPTLR